MIDIKVYELNLSIYLLKSIGFSNLNGEINKLIDKSFIHDEKMKKFHESNNYKFYCFNSLYPLEKDKVYKEGHIYNLIIRTIDINLSNYFKRYLANEYTDSMKGLVIKCREIPQKFIDKVYSITPVILKFEDGYWKTNNSAIVFEKRLKENLIKKYNSFFNEKIDENVEIFKYIKLENQKPIPVKYKDILLLGDKVTIEFAENEVAQKLAYIAIGCSVGEMGSRGMSYCNYKWI